MAEKQFVVFQLANEEYGVAIHQVREIIRYINITKVPNTPYYMEGIINLRGSVVPVLNLASQFKTESFDSTERRIVIIELPQQDFGIVVDQVTEVVRFDDSNIKEPPSMVSNRSKFMEGICQYGDHLVILLDLRKLLDQTELGELQTISNSRA